MSAVLTVSIRVDDVRSPVFVARVLDRVRKQLGVSAREIRGRSRDRHISRARHAAWGLLDAAGWSAYAIAREFGVDHTSVLYALGKPRAVSP